MDSESVFKILFVNQDKVYEIYARGIANDTLYGFVEVEELVFGERSQVVVDPSEEKLKSEFEGVKRTYIPMHAVIRIDEVEKEGIAKIKEEGVSSGNVHHLPVPGMKPPSGDKG